MTLLGSTLRELIGGRWAVSLLLFCIYVPLGIIATLGNLSTTMPGTTIGLLLVASTLSLLPVGLLLWASSITWLRHRREAPAPIMSIVLLGAAIGVARSASMYLLSVWIGIQEPDATLAWTRTISGGVQGATTYPLAVLAIALIATYREKRQALITAQITWEARRLHDAQEWAHMRDEVVAPIADELNALGDDLDRQVISVDAAASAVRQRAHDLWGAAQPAPQLPRVRLSATVIASLRARPFAPWLILLLWLPTTVGTTLAVGAIPRAPLGALAAGALLVAIFQIANTIASRWSWTWWLVLPIGLATAIVATSPSTGIFGAPNAPGNSEYTIVNAMWITLLVIITSTVVGALRRGEEILGELHAAVDRTSIETLAQEASRRRVVHDVASTLHGTLQGRLATLPQSDSAADAVRETLARLAFAGAAREITTLPDLVNRTLDPWASLLHIDVECPDGQLGPASAQALADSLEECLSNSFRHGGAQHVRCIIRTSPTAVDMTVTDDGTHRPVNGEVPGLGTRILDQSGEWTRTYGDGGVTVRVIIPT